MTAPTRRGLLAMAPAAALLAPASAAAGPADHTLHPDARLIALCEAFVQLEDDFDALHDPYSDTHGGLPAALRARSEELADRHHRIRALVVRIPARTLAGLRAKAAMMERDLRCSCLLPECVSPDEELMPYYDLARDTLALLGGHAA